MKSEPTIKNFGRRLANLRKQRGLTQRQLADKLGVSYRVIAYYEAESKHVAAHLLLPLSKILKVSFDELLGVKSPRQELDPKYAALWRKLKKAEQLSEKDRKSLVDYLDALMARSKLRHAS